MDKPDQSFRQSITTASPYAPPTHYYYFNIMHKLPGTYYSAFMVPEGPPAGGDEGGLEYLCMCVCALHESIVRVLNQP